MGQPSDVLNTRHPRAHQSDARRAQLDRLKEQRRVAARERIHAQIAAMAAARPLTVTLPRLVAEIQRIAMGAVMPTPAQFNVARPAVWPAADALCEHFATS